MKPVRGQFQSLSGHIEYDASGPEDLAVDVQIDAASVDTSNGYRDEHLRSSFFEADKFPRIHFKATRVLLDEESVEGELTIKGVSRPVVLKVSGVRDVRNAEGVRVLRCRATARVNRRDFGITENAEDAQGLAKILGHIQTGLDSFIADDVEVDIFMVAHEQLAPVAQRSGPEAD
jgi:polyisoprenoid-binding protein YceI